MIGPFRGEYFFLANFYPTDFGSVEHHYQAAKTNDPGWKREILNAPTAAIAKRLGRKAPMRPDWDEVKLQTMEDLVTMKFFASPELTRRLLATGDEELQEVNWWGDRFWGVCQGEGENHLGKILMKVRAEMRAAQENNHAE